MNEPEENAKIYIIEGISGLKPQEIIALNRNMALELYRQLHDESVIGMGGKLIDCRIVEEKEMERN